MGAGGREEKAWFTGQKHPLQGVGGAVNQKSRGARSSQGYQTCFIQEQSGHLTIFFKHTESHTHKADDSGAFEVEWGRSGALRHPTETGHS